MEICFLCRHGVQEILLGVIVRRNRCMKWLSKSTRCCEINVAVEAKCYNLFFFIAKVFEYYVGRKFVSLYAHNKYGNSMLPPVD